MAYALETQLARTRPDERRRQGVFYTPREVAEAIVRRADSLLKRKLDLPLGLADSTTWQAVRQRYLLPDPGCDRREPLVNILEPSAGSGIFLAAIIRQIHSNLAENGRRRGRDARAIQEAWQRFFYGDLPNRVHGIEWMPAAIDAAREVLAETLEATGLPMDAAQHVPLYCQNALEPDVHRRFVRPITVILGNPPYAAASTNTNVWIRNLLRGIVNDRKAFRSYFHVNGQPLQERKLWLHDDYVKFLRVAQWHIERAGVGVIGLVTNRGFLDNVTFRGLRYQLLDQFDQIEILDLNGGGKNRGTAVRLSRDESVFDVGQGVAISVLAQSPGEAAPVRQFGSLWGTRERKLADLGNRTWEELLPDELEPGPPHYFLLPHRIELREEYAQGVPVTQLFPQSTSTIVTARDALVMDIDRQRLLERIAEFRDTRLSDEQLRERYFPRPRSNKYAAGDTRGWKLALAREQLRADAEWKTRVVPCTYRPFDQRWIYWSGTMIDWPRGEVMQEMSRPGAMGLIVRRQMPPDRPCTFFFASSALTIDGILRSDNRGNETLIPQLFNGNENLRRDLLPEMLREVPVGEVFGYVYALFHSTLYREHFAEHLRLEFPRVFFPRQRSTWDELADQGRRLLDLHLDVRKEATPEEAAVSQTGTVSAGYPKWRDGQVWINRTTPIAPLTEADWLFHIGGHQVPRKWLKDRRHTELVYDDVRRYRQIIATVYDTRQAMVAIDTQIKKLGGLHRAFQIEPTQPMAGL